MSDSTDNKPKLRPGDIGYIGRGVPPMHSRIKPNEVRNPWGSKGKPREGEAATDDIASQMQEVLAKPIRAKDGKTYTIAEILFNALIPKVAVGNVAAMKFLDHLLEKYGAKPSLGVAVEDVDDNRKQLIDESVRRRQAKLTFGDRYLDDKAAEVEQGAAAESFEDGED